MVIPPLVHRVWLAGRRMPVDYRLHVEAWERHHPDWGHLVWTLREIAELPMRNRRLFTAAQVVSPADPVGYQSALARWEILHQYGGLVVDCDVDCLRPLDPLRSHRVFLAQSPTRPAAVTTTVVGAEPGHPFVGAVLDALPAAAAAYQGRSVYRLAGGGFITGMLAQLRPRGVSVLPWWLFTRAPGRSQPAYTHAPVGTAR